MATSPTVYRGCEGKSQLKRSCSPPPTFCLSHCNLEALHPSSGDLFSHSSLHHEFTALSPPMAYDYPSQSPEYLKRHHRPDSDGCDPSAWATTTSPSPPFSDSKSAVLIPSGSTPESGSTGLRSVSTPSIGFDNSTPASALSFSSPAIFSGELSSIHQPHSACDLTCYTCAPSFQRPLLSSTSIDDSSIPWRNHNLSIHSLPAAQLSPYDSLLILSDPVPSNSSSRSWTPDQTESLNPHIGRTEINSNPYQLPPIGSPTSTEKLARPFGSHQSKPSPGSRSKHNPARGFPQRLLINTVDTPRAIQSSLTSQISPFCEDAEPFMPGATFTPNATNLRSQLSENASQLCSPVTPLTANPFTSSSFGMQPAWFQSNHLSHIDGNQCHTEYERSANSHAFLPSPNLSPFGDSVPQPSQALNSKFGSPLTPSTVKLEPNNENENPLSTGCASMESVTTLTAHHANKLCKKKKREVREVEAACGGCGERMARLTLRGSPEELYVVDGFELVHTCKQCQEGRSRANSVTVIPSTVPAPFSGQSFMNAVKCEPVELLYPAPMPQNAMSTFRKRNRRTDDVTAPTTCDCCARQLGIGGIVPRNGRSAIQFVVEVVCVYCINNFRRCTDCGGGGGSRLGVGKWRCKELFSDGRRTCILSHQRQGASTEVLTKIWKVKDLTDKPELETLMAQLRELAKHSLYAALATPEMLESGLARVTRFEDIKNMYANGWKKIEPLICEDVEPSTGRRRYVGLRWTKPHPRKGPKRVSIADGGSPPIPSSADHDIILQPGKELSGFVLSEWDMHQGAFFVSVGMPWQSGDALESTTGLAHKSFLEAKSDRERLIDEMVCRGIDRREADLHYPPIRHLWTILFFHRDARLVQFLEKRRKFMPLEDYLSQYPDARREMFPPGRDCYVPADETHCWNIWVRRENGTRVDPQA